MSETHPETIGERLRRVRAEQGLSQRQISSPGVSAQYISKIEQGARLPSMKALRKLAPMLAVTVEYLETGIDHSASEQWTLALDDAALAIRLGEAHEDTAPTLRSVLDRATSAGNGRIAARARLMLGSLAAHTGDYPKAIAFLEASIAESWIDPASDPDVYLTLGHALSASGREDAAVELFRSCVTTLEQQNPVPSNTLARFATYLSYALTAIGDHDGARAAVGLAVQHGRDSRDAYTRIRIYWASSRAALGRGDLDGARRGIDRALSLLAETEDGAYYARALLLSAEIALAADDHELSNSCLIEAQEMLTHGASLEDRAYLVIQQAIHAARIGEQATAMDLATRAIGMLDDLKDPAIRGAAHLALAEAYAAADAHGAAHEELARAADLIPVGSPFSQRLADAWKRTSSVPHEG